MSTLSMGFLVAQWERIRLPVQEIWVQSQGGEDALEKEMPTHSNSCLGNPMDKGAWWTTVHGVTKESDTT